MKENICIFEDEGYRKLLPLVHLRAVFELKCGMFSLREKIERKYPEANFYLQSREILLPVLRQKVKNASCGDLSTLTGSCLFINGRVIADSEFNIPFEGEEEIGVSGSELIYVRLSEKLIQTTSLTFTSSVEVLKKLRTKLPAREINVKVIRYPWDLIKFNNEQICQDYAAYAKKGEILGSVDDRAVLYGSRENLYIGKGARVDAGVVLDAREGPIYIDEDVSITPPTIIAGPAFIGRKTNIDGAKIRAGVSIGEVCRIGGELEETIIQGYTNKHHDGFLGHAWLGEWVNLGAMTTNSDLKNNYGQIKIYVEGKLCNSGEIKLGCFIADHTKTGIGTLLNTGTVIGVGVNLFGGATLPPKYVPSFVWGDTPENWTVHDLEKCIANAERIMKRRKVDQTSEEAELLRKVFELTKEERKKAGVR